MPHAFMPDLIRHEENFKYWIPAFAGMTLSAIINVVLYCSKIGFNPAKARRLYLRTNFHASWRPPKRAGGFNMIRLDRNVGPKKVEGFFCF